MLQAFEGRLVFVPRQSRMQPGVCEYDGHQTWKSTHKARKRIMSSTQDVAANHDLHASPSVSAPIHNASAGLHVPHKHKANMCSLDVHAKRMQANTIHSAFSFFASLLDSLTCPWERSHSRREFVNDEPEFATRGPRGYVHK